MGFERQSSLGWLVAALHQKMAQALDENLSEYGLPVSLWPTMMCLWEEDNLTQVEIARRAQVQNYTTTRALDKLEAMGWVTRAADENSRRSHRIKLTEKGRAMKDIVLVVPGQVNQEITKNLSEDETQQLIQLLQKLVL